VFGIKVIATLLRLYCRFVLFIRFTATLCTLGSTLIKGVAWFWISSHFPPNPNPCWWERSAKAGPREVVLSQFWPQRKSNALPRPLSRPPEPWQKSFILKKSSRSVSLAHVSWRHQSWRFYVDPMGQCWVTPSEPSSNFSLQCTVLQMAIFFKFHSNPTFACFAPHNSFPNR